MFPKKAEQESRKNNYDEDVKYGMRLVDIKGVLRLFLSQSVALKYP